MHKALAIAEILMGKLADDVKNELMVLLV